MTDSLAVDRTLIVLIQGGGPLTGWMSNACNRPQPAGHILGLAVVRVAGTLRNLPNSLRKQFSQSGRLQFNGDSSATCSLPDNQWSPRYIVHRFQICLPRPTRLTTNEMAALGLRCQPSTFKRRACPDYFPWNGTERSCDGLVMQRGHMIEVLKHANHQ